MYSALHGLARACLPNLSVRNVWRASGLGSGEPLGGNTSVSGFGLGRLVWSTAGGRGALSGAGDAHGFHDFIGSRAGQCLQVRVKAFSSDGRPGAVEQAHASHHVAHDSADFRIVEATLAGSHIWHLIRGKRILVLLDVYASPGDLVKSMGRSWSSLGEPSPNLHSTYSCFSVCVTFGARLRWAPASLDTLGSCRCSSATLPENCFKRQHVLFCFHLYARMHACEFMYVCVYACATACSFACKACTCSCRVCTAIRVLCWGNCLRKLESAVFPQLQSTFT